MIPDFDPPPLRVRCLSLSYTQNKKINVAKCGITEASNTSLSPSTTDGLLPAAAAAHALRVRVQMATPTAPVGFITHQSFGWSGYHDCILGPGVVPEALSLSESGWWVVFGGVWSILTGVLVVDQERGVNRKGLFRAWRGLTWTRTSGSSGWRYVAACRTVVVAQAFVVVVLDLRSFVEMWLEFLVEYIFRWEVCSRYDL